jgi:hypothetical protein
MQNVRLRIALNWTQPTTIILKNIDLKGMECRWEEISPRNKENQVVCLLALCADEQQQATLQRLWIIHLVLVI